MKIIKRTSSGSELVDLISNNHTYSDTVANETEALRNKLKLPVKGRRPKLHANVHPKLDLSELYCKASMMMMY